MQAEQMPRHPALTSLAEELEGHPVISNIFFETFRARRLSHAQLQTFLRQYRYFCKHFVKLLEGLLFRAPVDEIEMRVELVKTLHSELGSGDPEQAHITLLDRFARSLGLDEDELDRTDPIPSVTSYLATLRHLFLETDYLTALGAELSVEITAAAEFRYLYPGLQQYGWFREEDLAFFRLHLAEEVCHATWLLDAVERTARSDADIERVASGARQVAEAWHQFWVGLYEHVFPSSPVGASASSVISVS